MKIEVLLCKNCSRLVISVDDCRIPTESCAAQGHGSGKCSGAWTIMVAANCDVPAGVSEEPAPVPLLEFQTDRMSETEWSADTWMRLGDKRELLGYLPCDSEEEAVKECGRLQQLYAAARAESSAPRSLDKSDL